MEGYGGIWNQWSARPKGPMWAQGSQRAPLAPDPPIYIPVYLWNSEPIVVCIYFVY